ncbi:hypothetical protein [Phascolarctobacterium faecium]|uniref:hypothetical protein n=3 Tax=Phascolarctobacterium faecium TaxID=33025 RepID=UPI00265DE7A2|nr:hypothetical protein [Phascolarctobacterium faecium]
MKLWEGLNKDNIQYYLEEYSPYALGFMGGILGLLFDIHFNIGIDDLEKIFGLVITVTAITVGFIGVLLGIIATIKNNPNVKNFFSRGNGKPRKRLELYFMNSLHYGMGLIFYSIFLLILTKISLVKNEIALLLLHSFWCYLLFYSLASYYRVISFVMFMLFADDKTELEDKPELPLISEEKKREMQKKYSKN